jgi:hypothetical protein
MNDMVQPLDDDAIRTVVTRLSRRHASGGAVIERAAILAEGANSTAILAWITEHDWLPEENVPATSKRETFGLHAARKQERDASRTEAPRRYVLAPGATA